MKNSGPMLINNQTRRKVITEYALKMMGKKLNEIHSSKSGDSATQSRLMELEGNKEEENDDDCFIFDR